jgi:hypothetical protein
MIRLIALGSVAISTRRSSPAQCTHTRTSTAKTRFKSHAAKPEAVPRCLLFSVIFLDTLRPLLAEEFALCVVVRHTVSLKLFRSTRYHLRPQRGVRGLHTRVTRQVETRRRHHGAEACEPIFGRQHHCPRPVAPRLTKRNLHTYVGSLREPFEGNRWPRHIAA